MFLHSVCLPHSGVLKIGELAYNVGVLKTAFLGYYVWVLKRTEERVHVGVVCGWGRFLKQLFNTTNDVGL